MILEREATGPRGLALLVRLEEAISVALLVLILGLLLVQIVGRSLPNVSYIWTEELTRFGLVWLTFIGAAYVMAQGRHITIDVANQLLGGRGRKVLDIVSSLVALATCAMLLPASFVFTSTMHYINSPAADVPMSLVYGAGLSGFSLLTLHCLVRLISALRRDPDSYVDEDIVAHTPGIEHGRTLGGSHL